MSARTPEEARNEKAIRSLYSLANGNSKDTTFRIARPLNSPKA